MTRDGFNVYIQYIALQRHFSSDYDYFKYNGKVNAKTESYTKRNDLYSFEKLTKILPADQREDFFVSHFLDNPKEWIKNMSKQKYELFVSLYKHLPKTFREDLEKIALEGPSNVIQTGSDIPRIHKMVMSDEIKLETVIILDRVFPIMSKHKEEVNIPFVWPDYVRKFEKYQPFVMKKIGEDFYKYVDIARDVLLKH